MTNHDHEPWKIGVRDEVQYSIWLVDRDLRAGWNVVGREGSKEECLAHIKEVATDTRPESLRTQMAHAWVTL